MKCKNCGSTTAKIRDDCFYCGWPVCSDCAAVRYERDAANCYYGETLTCTDCVQEIGRGKRPGGKKVA